MTILKRSDAHYSDKPDRARRVELGLSPADDDLGLAFAIHRREGSLKRGQPREAAEPPMALPEGDS